MFLLDCYFSAIPYQSHKKCGTWCTSWCYSSEELGRIWRTSHAWFWCEYSVSHLWVGSMTTPWLFWAVTQEIVLLGFTISPPLACMAGAKMGMGRMGRERKTWMGKVLSFPTSPSDDPPAIQATLPIEGFITSHFVSLCSFVHSVWSKKKCRQAIKFPCVKC